MPTHDTELTTIDFCLIAALWGMAIALVLAGLVYRLGVSF